MSNSELLLPCATCNYLNVAVGDGNKFQWKAVACHHCGAHLGKFNVVPRPPPTVASSSAEGGV